MNKKTVIVTGGAQGIGKISARRFLEAGFYVSVFETDKEALDEAKTELADKNMQFVLCDVSDENQVISAIEQTIAKSSGIDVLINNAAIWYDKPIGEFTLNEWNRVIGANLTGTFLCSKYAAPFLKASNGCIINMASTRALMSEPGSEAYAATKGGIISLTHALAVSLGPRIKVNCISPGWIEVSMHKKSSDRKEPFLSEADHSQHPAGRVGNADDIVNMQLFLADGKNGFITGQNFIIDGGMTKKMIYV
jgi:NAD(P)-dependent dehydrogenase (short-subunit alcohol dehydrogenase family)